MIPHTIHQIFFGGESAVLPAYREYAQTWRTNHPEWTFEFWDAQRCRDLVAQHYPEYLALYDGYGHRIQKCDAVRYFILHHHGGLYVDMDIESLKPVDDLTAGCDLLLGALFIGWTNAVMGSVAGHPAWPGVFEMLEKRKSRFFSKAPWWTRLTMPMHVGFSTGPILLSDSMRAGGWDKAPRVCIVPTSTFEPLALLDYPGAQPDLSQSYGIHHMSKHWVPIHHRAVSAVFGGLSKTYWSTTGRKSG